MNDSTEDARAQVTTAAVDHLAEMLRPNWDMLDDAWASFSCTEIEAVAEVFRTAGYRDFAATIIEGHTMHDEPGDDHYRGEN